MSYRLAFFFSKEAAISIEKLNFLLRDIGQRTMKVVNDELWYHKRYKSSIWWETGESANVLYAKVTTGKAVRTCGSLVEWMLRNAGDLLDESGGDLEGVSVFR